MNPIIVLALCVLCLIVGAWLDHRFSARATAAVQRERDQLLSDYRNFAAKAHEERDALAEKLGLKKSQPAAAPAAPAPANQQIA